VAASAVAVVTPAVAAMVAADTGKSRYFLNQKPVCFGRRVFCVWIRSKYGVLRYRRTKQSKPLISLQPAFA
jgi:hypothetical protein